MTTVLPLPEVQVAPAPAHKQAARLPLARLHLHHKLCIPGGNTDDPYLEQWQQAMHLVPLAQVLADLQAETAAAAVYGQVAEEPAVELSGYAQKQ